MKNGVITGLLAAERCKSMSNKKILIVGAGVQGLTTGLQLLAAGHDVTFYTKEPVGVIPHTSHSAYAMWVPVNFAPRLEDWANLGLAQYQADAADLTAGVVLRNIFQLQTERSEPWFAASYPGFRHAEPGEIASEYADAHVLPKAPIIDPTVYLPWLRAKVVAAGAHFKKCEVTDLNAVPAGFDVVINCSGLGSRKLAGDETVFAERVQVLTICNFGQVDSVFIDDAGPNQRACVVPHKGYIKLGAVFTSRNEDIDNPDQAAVADILARCNRMVPGLDATADDVIATFCAARPERTSWVPRVEKTTLADGRTLVHNYGHDGMGFLLAPGIALEIAGYVAAD